MLLASYARAPGVMPALSLPHNVDGFDELEALRPAIRGLAAHLLRERIGHPDVDDCTSETFRRALEGRDRLHPGAPVRPWLLGIARHVALDLLRARRRSAQRDAGDGDELASSPTVERLADPGPLPDMRTEQRERAARIQAAMQQLPEQPREALLLFHIEGLGYREIAERMRVPIGTVGTWVTRGRQSLATALSENKP